jgi:trans-aconitate 3-methyltransferase
MLSAVQIPEGTTNIEFKVGTAEELSFIPSGSVDMVTSGQAAHWFKQEVAFAEIARILKPGGTVAFFGTLPSYPQGANVGYGGMAITGHPELRPLMQQYVHGGPGTLGPYWEEPGRTIVEGLYRSIVPPFSQFTHETRYFFPREGPSGERERLVQISSKLSLGVMATYARTWSSFHGWQNDFPDKKSRESGGEGDIVDEMIDVIKEHTGWDDSSEFEVEWDSMIMLARKKE